MNQTFSITRFGRLTRKHFTDNRGQLLSNVAVLIAGLIILATVIYTGKYPQAVERTRQIPFFFIGWAAWYVFTWQQTETLNQKERAITYLLQPASRLEKITLIWLLSGVGFLLVYALVFTVIDGVGVSYVNQLKWTPAQQKMVGSYQLVSWYKSDEFFKAPLMIWVLSALLHPVALAFLLSIRRFTLPLVAVLAFCFFIGGMFLNSAILSSLTGSDSASYVIPFSNFWAQPLTGESFYRTVSLPQPLGNQIRYVVGVTAVVLLYIIAYFRLKEREV